MDDLQVRAAATDIFSYLVEFSPSMVREFVMQEPQQAEDDVSANRKWRLHYNKHVYVIATSRLARWAVRQVPVKQTWVTTCWWKMSHVSE